MKGRRLLRLAVLVVVGVALGLVAQRFVRVAFLGPGEPNNLAMGRTTGALPQDARPTVVATGLDTPWDIRFLSDGDLLVTERRGRLLRLGPDCARKAEHTIPDVVERAEAGLMGLALHPDFETNRLIYVCFTTDAGGGLTNRVERYRYDGGLADRTQILTGIPGAPFHNGCRLEFGPGGSLYVTTGDAGNADLAQDRGSLAGKIFRLTDEGAPAPGNPFGNAVFSFGHRNPQGLSFNQDGVPWSTEHGPSGAGSGFDEVNRIEAGGNYGWPVVQGDESRGDMVTPVVHSGGDVTWAPAGAAWAAGSLFFAGLRGQALYEMRLGGNVVPHFFREYGRLRPVRVGPDGLVYFGTSNRDGRGNPAAEDDRIFRFDPAALMKLP